MKLWFTHFLHWTAYAAALGLGAPAWGQETVGIESFKITPVSFEFSSVDGVYHLVEASQDLRNWVVVGQYQGNGETALYQDRRGNSGDVEFFRLTTKPNPFQDGLLEREWHLIAFHELGEVIKPKEARTHSIKLSRNKRVEGRNDCNQYFGSFSLVKGNWLKFGAGFGSTLMLCLPGSLDFKFFQVLEEAKGFEVQGNKLTVYYGSKSQNWLEFKDKT